jgi:hypothetical protein
MSLATVYKSMKQRCCDPNHQGYHNYGGRGIYVCEEWLKDKQLFLTWAQNAGYAPGLTLDRIDNNGPYSPDNCRFATWPQQQRNTRRNRVATFGGVSKLVQDWSTDLGFERSTIGLRLKRGMPLERALSPADLRRPAPICGTRSGYNHGCKCNACRAFNAQRARDNRLRLKRLG